MAVAASPAGVCVAGEERDERGGDGLLALVVVLLPEPDRRPGGVEVAELEVEGALFSHQTP